MKCACGNKMTKVIVDEYDFTDLAGLPVIVQRMPALKCKKCGEEMLAGADISRVLEHVAITIIQRVPRLGAKEAKFLRGQLGLTQKELAARMGLHKITVAAWESKKSISPQHDHILRTIVLAKLSRTATPAHLHALGHVHTAKPLKSPRKVVIEKLAS
jgi:YgiT-type zinc finger domain-containing protein